MSRESTSFVDRPPEARSLHPVVVGSSRRAVRLLCGALLLWAGVALAQDRPRLDPGSPPPNPGHAPDGWSVVTIPGLPAGAVLGDVWVSPGGVVYVWAKYPPKVGTNWVEDPAGEGEREPDPRGEPGALWSSNLYRFDGAAWSATLRVAGEMGVALLGSGADQVFATTVSRQGEARLYHLQAGVWQRETLPGRFLGMNHSLAGTAGDLYFKVDRAILHHDGVRVTLAYELPSDESVERGMVDLLPDALFVMSGDCHFLFHDGVWACVKAGFDFGHVEDAWGTRDTNGRLHMYAIGDDGDDSELKVWQYDENDRTLHDGIWVPVLQDPLSGHVPGLGSGYRLWGGAGNDVYATGVVGGEGHMMHFDGARWSQLVPPPGLGTVRGVWGTGGGTVWFSIEAGQMVRYQRPNSAPDVAAAVPSVSRLWPADLRFVAVDILGVTDAEGDGITIQVDRVLSDENPTTANVAGNCPDARILGARAMLRAEHNANGDGRTYKIEFTATDRLGMSRSGVVHVCAPHYETTPCDVDAAIYDAAGGCVGPGGGRKPFDTDDRNGALRVHYELDQATAVHLGVYDVAGRLRGTIEQGERAAGVHETSWDLSGLDAGIYFVKLRTRGAAFTRRVVVIR